MNFKTYDILSSLVPGFIMLLVLIPILGYDYNKDYAIGYTAIAFLLGYFLNTIGSWLEDFYFFSWGGKPSSNLLDGKDIWKVRIYNSNEIKDSLKKLTKNIEPSNNELFGIAMRKAFSHKETRIEDFNSFYAFSRTMLTCALISSICLIINYYYDFRVYITLIVVLVFWYRCKQRAYYLCKEIINIYYNRTS